MNTWRWTMALVAGGALVAACTTKTAGEDDDGGGGTGGNATSVTTSGVGPSTGAVMTTTTTTGTAPSGGVCGGTSTFEGNPPDPAAAGLDQCLTDNCCTSFDACNANAACTACLSNPMGTGCDTQAEYQAFTTCFDDSCAGDICDSGIGFANAWECNACAGGACCTSMDACVNGGSGENDPKVDACIECLNDAGVREDGTPTGLDLDGASNGCLTIYAADSAEVGGTGNAEDTAARTAVQTAAGDFNTCLGTSCGTECGG